MWTILTFTWQISTIGTAPVTEMAPLSHHREGATVSSMVRLPLRSFWFPLPTPLTVGHTHGDCSGIDTSCGVTSLGTYNQGLHIGAIFIVLVTSALGVMIPLISGRRRSGSASAAAALSETKPLFRQNSFWSSLFFVAKHFGTVSHATQR